MNAQRWGVSFMYHVAVSQKELIQVGQVSHLAT